MKILILGTTGSGKTTLAKKLSHELGIPHLELDALFWNPNWERASDEVFRSRLKEALRGESWIVDGNYSLSRDLVWAKADVAIWLDYSLFTILKNLVKRTKRNIKSQKELWPGCRETWKMQLFSTNSIFIWFAKSFWKKKWKYPKLLASFPNLKVLRLKSPKELTTLRFKDDGGFKTSDFTNTDVCRKQTDK